jgi:hypothetical protein
VNALRRCLALALLLPAACAGHGPGQRAAPPVLAPSILGFGGAAAADPVQSAADI